MFSYTVVYVEDDMSTQNMFEKILSNYFANVVSFNDGKKALEYLSNSSCDVLVTDIDIPNVSGLDLASEAKKRNLFLPVVIISAHSDYNTLVQAIEIGVDGYILKPISSNKFINKIVQVMNKASFIRKSYQNENLLKQYKEAIDRSSIVSKTDIHGDITYVNESFCEISGYVEDELLGKSHNIVRHPDMSSLIFKDMWSTIEQKKPWVGIIKNQKKDGSAYYVKSLINPILNEEGEIKEYIAIRDDITELEEYKENLEAKLKKSTQKDY